MSSGWHPSANRERAKQLRDLGEVEYNRRALRRAAAWMSEHPWTFAQLSLQRCFRFWFSTPLHPLEFGLTFPVTLAGIWSMLRLRKTRPAVFGIWSLTLLAFSLIYYVTQYSARYRAAVDWMMWIAAGQLCVAWAASGLREARRQRIATNDLAPAGAAERVDQAGLSIS
jgi:hypothetical protein